MRRQFCGSHKTYATHVSNQNRFGLVATSCFRDTKWLQLNIRLTNIVYIVFNYIWCMAASSLWFCTGRFLQKTSNMSIFLANMGPKALSRLDFRCFFDVRHQGLFKPHGSASMTKMFLKDFARRLKNVRLSDHCQTSRQFFVFFHL